SGGRTRLGVVHRVYESVTPAGESAYARRSRSELLRELHPVAVRVVDVEEPHLALELEDDADVDAGRPQPLGLGLEVGHVDGRDRAVRLGLALGQPELHLAVL